MRKTPQIQEGILNPRPRCDDLLSTREPDVLKPERSEVKVEAHQVAKISMSKYIQE